MTKQITLPSGEYLLVDVPDGSGKYLIVKDTFRWRPDPLKFWWDQAKLPPGSWEIVGKGSEITQEVWRGILLPNMSPIADYKVEGERWLAHMGHKPESVLVLRKVK